MFLTMTKYLVGYLLSSKIKETNQSELSRTLVLITLWFKILNTHFASINSRLRQNVGANLISKQVNLKSDSSQTYKKDILKSKTYIFKQFMRPS